MSEIIDKAYIHYRKTLHNSLVEIIKKNNIDIFSDMFEKYFEDAETEIDVYIEIAQKYNKKEIFDYLLDIKNAEYEEEYEDEYEEEYEDEYREEDGEEDREEEYQNEYEDKE